MIYIIYGLQGPKSDEVRYVGSTSCTLQMRLANHLSTGKTSSKTTPLINWLKGLTKAGLKPRIISLEQVINTQRPINKEKEWCKHFKALGYELLNSGCEIRERQSIVYLRIAVHPALAQQLEICSKKQVIGKRDIIRLALGEYLDKHCPPTLMIKELFAQLSV